MLSLPATIVCMSNPLFGHKKYWAHKLTPAREFPMSLAEMDQLGWDACDVILITGDAYVDHPSFGAALIGRVLEAHGFRVGIIAQPDWRSSNAFQTLGSPHLFFGVTSGNMDSMVNHYTADRKPRSDDAYSPDNQSGKRPDRALIVYTQRCREEYPDVPVIIGGIEASLRRIAHYDYWSDAVRRSILIDSKASLLVFGNGERPIVDIAHRLAAREPISEIRTVRGTACVISADSSSIAHTNDTVASEPSMQIVQLPSFESVFKDTTAFLESMRLVYRESNPFNARQLAQAHGNRMVMVNPPSIPLSTAEMDRIYDLPFTRKPHSDYRGARIPAYDMIRHSATILRGCFGGCSFCSITLHEGRIIQNRSIRSIASEIETIRDHAEGFTGMISDIGGPTANMYAMRCKDPRIQARCRRLSCVFPKICSRLQTDHRPLLKLMAELRKIPGIRKILVSSGIRHDLALRSHDYIRTLAAHHVGGHLKLAPEHTDPSVLRLMMKPGITDFEEFESLFKRYSADAGLEQYIVPYFIAGHPGSTSESMIELARWLKSHKYRPQQVQTFLPLPMTLAGAMYYANRHPLILNARMHRQKSTSIYIPKKPRERMVQKSLLRYYHSDSHSLIREELIRLNREDLIGRSANHLVPPESKRPDPRVARSAVNSPPRRGKPPSRKHRR